jgi:hypothetical protein
MILNDEVIKDGLNYHNHWISLSKKILAKSHLEANARIRELETAMAKESNEQYKSQISRLHKEVRVAKNNFALAEQLLDWVDKAIEGEEVCDFAESFPLVRKAVDLYFRIQELEVKLWDLRKIIERNSKDLPSEFSQLLDDHFWEIAQAEKETK